MHCLDVAGYCEILTIASLIARSFRHGGICASQSSSRRRGPEKMKRQHTTVAGPQQSKKPRIEYHETPSLEDGTGNIVWPAPQAKMDMARTIIKKWYTHRNFHAETSAAAGQTTLIAPDKDADGLTSGVILFRTLRLLGLAEDCIRMHFVHKGETIHSSTERSLMAAAKPSYIFVLDQGSRASPPLIQTPHVTLIIDHHFAGPTDFPQDSNHVNASQYPPVATASLLTFEICKTLHDAIEQECSWLCCVGTHGDLGNSLKWSRPFPDMTSTFKRFTKGAINAAVPLINAPRRTATFDVPTAWDALIRAQSPKDIANHPRLVAAKQEINAEVERITHTPPVFSKDGQVAVFRIKSPAQVHPLVATRWASHLKSHKLKMVLVANNGYQIGVVHFSCRIAKVANQRAAEGADSVNIIELLRQYAVAHDSGTLLERMGESFARGHVQASGGIVPAQEFEDLMLSMQIGVKPDEPVNKQLSKPRHSNSVSRQKNTLERYFATQ